jgi:photosystem II stability/assembly factor-like uncharacterized protein
MLGRAICCWVLTVACGGCTVVSCPSDMNCSLKNNAAPQGGSASAEDEEGGAGGSPEDATGAGLHYLPGEWVNVSGNLDGMPSACGNLSGVFEKPDSDVLIAGVALDGLWTNTDGSADWVQLGTGKGSEVVTNTPGYLVFDPDNSNRFWEAGIHGNSDGAYATSDGGTTFSPINVGYGADTITVDFSNAERKLLFATGHETPRMVEKSTNGGAIWTSIAGNLPNDPALQCTIFLQLDATNYLLGCGGGKTSIFRTADRGNHWTKVSDGGGMAHPLVAADGSIYWMTAVNAQLLRSTDLGQTWVEVFPPNQLAPVPPIALPDGRIVAMSPTSLVISADHGVHWDYASPRLPHDNEMGVMYSAKRKAFYIWRWDCTTTVPVDAILRFDFDYETQ